MVLILLLTAQAQAETLVHASVSTGWQCLPALLPELSNASGFAYTRFEVGAGPEMVQIYGTAQMALHNGLDIQYSNQYSDGLSPVVGDTRFTNVGVGARLPIPFGVFRLVPHVDIGGAFADAPMDQDFYASDIEPLIAGGKNVGIHGAGIWAQVGADAGFTIIEDAVDVFIASDGGWMTITAVGPVADVRVGLSGRF